MAEVGLDLSQEFPKPLTDEATQAADVIITMGCGDACTIYPGKRYLNWKLADPAGKSLEEVRSIRDEIDQYVRQLLAELVQSAAPGWSEPFGSTGPSRPVPPWDRRQIRDDR